MGSAVAGRLLAAGHEVHGWNRTREKAEALVPRGLHLAGSAREAAEGADAVFTMVAEKGGIDREVAVDMMLSSVIASPMLAYRGPFVLDQPEQAWFDCNMMQKDMLLALEAGREHGVPMPLTAAANELLSAARGMGIDHYDLAVTYDVLAAQAGVKGSLVS